MTESGRERAKMQAVHEYLYGHASVEDQFGQGFDKGWQAAFEAGRGGWISVETGWPEIETPVDAIVCGTERIIAMRVCNTDEGWCWAQCRDSGFDLKDGYTLAEFEEDDLNVTHWMALPAPPDSGDVRSTGTCGDLTRNEYDGEPEPDSKEWWKAEAYRLENTIRLLRTELGHIGQGTVSPDSGDKKEAERG